MGLDEIKVRITVDKTKLRNELEKLREMDCDTCKYEDTEWCNSCFAGEHNYYLDSKVINEIINNCIINIGNDEMRGDD